MKTHSGAKKRFKKTGNGKVKRSKAYRSHHAWAKTTKQKRGLRQTAYVHAGDLDKVLELLPY